MNTIILYAMAIAALVVVVAGGFFAVVLIVYAIQNIWAKVSACAKNTIEYLRSKKDFEMYKKDILRWDMAQRERAVRCHECPYRRKYIMDGEGED